MNSDQDHGPNAQRNLTQNPRTLVSTSSTASHDIRAPPLAPTQPTFPANIASNTAPAQQWQAFATGGVQQNDRLRAENNTLRGATDSIDQRLRSSYQEVATLQQQLTKLQTQITNQAQIINGQADIIRRDTDLQQQATIVQRNADLEELIKEREERVRQLDKQVWQITGKGKPWEDQACSLCGRSGSMGRVGSERQDEGAEDKGNETRKGKAKDKVERKE